LPKPRSAKLETPTARRKLAVRLKAYFTTISPGIYLGYRRNVGAGSWSVRRTEGTDPRTKKQVEWAKRLALADDLEPADGRDVLTFWQAIDAARKLARRQPGDPAEDESKPLTVSAALDRYEADLRSRSGDAYNAQRARIHLPGTLASKPVSMLSANELRRWRDGLAAKGLAPATVNRTRTTLRAALELAAAHDPHRIVNASAWKVGLKGLPDATVANNVILDDATVRAVIAEAYKRDPALGLFVDVAAVTGARPSQIVRLTVADLDLAERAAPRLLMPKSAKGGTAKRAERKLERIPVPITAALAALLKQASKGRASEAPLLLRSNGEPWAYRRSDHYRQDIRKVVEAIGRDPDAVTIYSLRHSSIVRHLLANTPIRVVAALHDTSVGQIERHYSKHIARHSDEIARRALLQPEQPASPKVIPLSGR
jgi:integrase